MSRQDVTPVPGSYTIPPQFCVLGVHVGGPVGVGGPIGHSGAVLQHTAGLGHTTNGSMGL